MKVLLISDLHSQKRCLGLLREIIEKHRPDSLVCSGDITQYDETSYLEEFLSIIHEQKIEGYLIWGNNDRAAVSKIILDSPYSIHLKQRMLGKWKIFGISEIEDIPQIKPESINGAILVTHRPPKFDSLRKPHTNAPEYHISGHVHNAGKIIKFPSTTLIQVPSLMFGRYAIFDLNDKTIRYYKI